MSSRKRPEYRAPGPSDWIMRRSVEKMVVLAAFFDTRVDEEKRLFSSVVSSGVDGIEASEEEMGFELTCALALATLNG